MARKLSGRDKAFAKARREQGADGTFTYEGKKYHTRRADDPPTDKKLRTAPVPKPKPKPRSQPTITPKTIRVEPTRGSSRPRKDPAAAGIKKIRGGKTPREALADKTHSSSSKDASGKGPGSTRHPGTGLGGATIRKAVEDSARSNPADARRAAMPIDNEEEVARSKPRLQPTITPDPPTRKLSGRDKAFAKARREHGADGTFTYEGKKYHTRRADDPPKRRKKSPTTMLDVVGGLSKGGMLKYNKGGKIRGHGMARGGRPCKMVGTKSS